MSPDLHRAIAQQSEDIESIRKLLRHGAHVNALDSRDNTPLNLAVKKAHFYREVIIELLEYGADINIRNRECRSFENYATPLDNAMRHYPERAKLLIKYAMIKNLDTNYRDIIVYNRYGGNWYSPYVDDCVCELKKMKTDHLSFYELIASKKTRNTTTSKPILHVTDDRFFQLRINYPIYYEVISSRIDIIIERASLLNKLSEFQVYTKSDTTDQTVVLDCYSKDEIAKYLSNNDLLNLLTAFYRCKDKLSCFQEDTESTSPLKPGSDEASESDSAKRARLE